MPFDIGNFSLDIKDLQTRAKGGIVTDGLVLHLDAAYKNSYPDGGTTWYDLSGNGNHGTMTNGASYILDNSGIISLDGSDDKISISDINNNFDFGTGEFTINCWINPSYDNTYPHIFTLNDQSNFSLKAIRFDNSDGGKLYVYQGYSVIFNNSYLITDTWQMITLTRSGQIHKLYINGVLNDTVTDNSGPKNISTTTAHVGWGWSSEYTPQKRGPIHVYNRSLSPDEVWQNYENTKNRFTWEQGTSIVTDGLVLHLDAGNTSSYPGSGTTWYDLSGNGNHGTLTNGPTFNSDNGGSIVFDGSNDYVTISNVQPNTGDFTISVWVYKDNNTSNDYIWDFGSNGGTLSAGTDVNGYGFRYYNSTLGMTSNIYTQGTVPNINTWYYVTIVRSNGTSTMYVNGQSITSSLGDTHNISSTTLYIGRYGGGTGYEHDGRISYFTIYNRALSAAEITQNYNATKGRFGL